ncbi:MBL fold metallo-hydrolase [Vulgatibacter sp.]|uniref:MBL fold metallo-hydrolase n=1 Tax=Vulgatibacter sp. TaxID=1971226 RepID=UPI003565AD2C
MNRILVALALAAAATGCAHVPAETPHAATPTATWDAALGEGPRVEVIPLLTGEIQVDRSFLLDFDNGHLHDRTDAKKWVPVLAYLVRHPTQGDLLIDTGFDHTFAESGHGNLGGIAFLASFARQQQGHDVVSLLRELEVDPARLRMIVLSHMHPDHTAGLPDLPKTVPVITGPGAVESYGGPWYAPADHLAGIESLRALALPDEGAVDLFGDGSLLVLPTPGHAAGNLSFLLRAQGGPVLLTCDASHTREGFDLGVAPGGVDDRATADASLDALRRFVAAHPMVRVKAGHEASDWDLTRGIQDAL